MPLTAENAEISENFSDLSTASALSAVKNSFYEIIKKKEEKGV